MQKERESNDDQDVESISDPIEAQISTFAAKIGQETGNKFFVYIYRMVKNEETGRNDRPFLRRYIGVEPDPQELAEKYRGGKYLVTFCWKHNKVQKSKSYTLDIDSEAFPPIPKDGTQAGNSMIALAGNNGVSDQMKLQLIMMQTIGEVMKEAYKSGGPQQVQLSADPMEQFSGMLQAMESNYSNLMHVQSKMFERVLSKNMEIKYGLEPESQANVSGTDQGILGQYGPLINDIVAGLKTVFSYFGDKVPKEVVRKVQSDDRFKELRSNPKALVAVGQTLRREFGDVRAGEIMKSFGVVMKVVPPPAKTPDIPGISAPGAAKINVNKKGGNGKVAGAAVPKRAMVADSGK
jgi:hypothetical protein